MLMFKEGLTCTITVFRNPESISLLVNGKADASTPSGLYPLTDFSPQNDLHDLPTQSLVAHIPLLLAPHRDEVLVVGLGTGVTLGSVLTHPVKAVQCIELEDAVVRGSRFFEEFNGRPLADRRTELVVNDARNHLLVTDKKYDVLISEPSNPWIPGAANLFTREFFELSKTKLQPEGVFCQWIQLYELQESHFQTILHTFTSVFPEVHVFRVKHDAILVGSAQANLLRESELRSRLTPPIKKDLARIHVRNVEDFLAWYWIGGEELKSVTRNEPFNTDDNMLIEFAAPLQLLVQHSQGTARPLAAMFDGRSSGALSRIELAGSTDQAKFWAQVADAALRIKTGEQARVYAERSAKLSPNPQAAHVLAAVLNQRGDRARALPLLQEAEQQFPQSPELLRALGNFHSLDRQWKAAAGFAERLLIQVPNDPVGLFCLGRAQYYLGERAASLATLERIPSEARQMQELDQLSFYLGALYSLEKRYAEAADQYRIFLKTDPAHIEARSQLADALYHSGNISEAITQWQQIGRFNAGQATRLLSEAARATGAGNSEEATRKLEKAVQLDSNNSDLVLLLARQKQARGDLQAAIELLQGHLQWHPDRPLVVGYLSQLLAAQKDRQQSALLAARYRALTGREWEQIP